MYKDQQMPSTLVRAINLVTSMFDIDLYLLRFGVVQRLAKMSAQPRR